MYTQTAKSFALIQSSLGQTLTLVHIIYKIQYTIIESRLFFLLYFFRFTSSSPPGLCFSFQLPHKTVSVGAKKQIYRCTLSGLNREQFSTLHHSFFTHILFYYFSPFQLLYCHLFCQIHHDRRLWEVQGRKMIIFVANRRAFSSQCRRICIFTGLPRRWKFLWVKHLFID